MGPTLDTAAEAEIDAAETVDELIDETRTVEGSRRRTRPES